MRLVLGTRRLGLGGTESYLLTVAEQLERLGHEVTLFAADPAPAVVEARPVVSDPGALPDPCDGVLAQDAVSAHRLAERYPGVPQAFVAHSDEYVLQTPPQVPGAVRAVVVLNDRIGRRLAALAHRVEVVRLSQPIDVRRFFSGAPAPARPRRALVIGNHLRGARYAAVEEAGRALGLELVRAGRHGEPTARPAEAMRDADVVLGIGRCVLEAMACERPAYVIGMVGTDGWVTPETYPALEADGFSGRAEDGVLSPGRLRADLGAPPEGLGPAGRDLVLAHHRAEEHAVALVALFARLRPGRARPATPDRELARLARAEWEATELALAARDENWRLRLENERLRAESEALRHDRARAERRAADADARVDALRRTRRYRLAAGLARPLDRLRARLARNG